MKSFLFSFLLTCSIFIQSVFAQTDVYRFSISGQRASFLLKGYYVERVLNAQEEDTILGVLQSGTGKINRLIAFGGSITDEIGSFLKSAFPPSEGMQPLIVRINKIEILEASTSSRETSTTSMNLSFIHRDGDRFYHLFDACTCIQQEGFDVTNSLPSYIVHALQTCFADLRSALILKRTDVYEINESDLTSNPLKDPGKYRVFNKGKMQKGILHSFYDFRDCRADTSIPFLVHYLIKKDTAIMKARINYTPIDVTDKIWGFSDGHDVYMRIAKDYYKLYTKQNRIISHVALMDMTGDLPILYLGGGLIGALIVGTIIGATSGGFTDPSEDGYFRIDFCNGNLVPADSPEFMDLNSRTIFHVPVNMDTSKSICFFVNNEYHVTLKRGQFYTLVLPWSVRNARIGMQMGDNIRHAETIPYKFFKNDFYIIRTSDKKGIWLDHPSGDLKRQYLDCMMEWNTVHRKKGVTGDCSYR